MNKPLFALKLGLVINPLSGHSLLPTWILDGTVDRTFILQDLFGLRTNQKRHGYDEIISASKLSVTLVFRFAIKVMVNLQLDSELTNIKC